MTCGRHLAATGESHIATEPKIELCGDHYDCATSFTGQPRSKLLNDYLIKETSMGKYNNLPICTDKIMATYIWIDETGENLRCKGVTLNYIPKAPKDKFNYLLEKMENKLLKDAIDKLTNAYAYKYMAPYFCPKNLENTGNVQCGQRESRNTNVFDENHKDLPLMHFDGDHTGMSWGVNNEIIVCPRAIYRNPFKEGHHILVMCDTYDIEKAPTKTNHRWKCEQAYNRSKEEEPWFGIEQQYFIQNCSDQRPYGWPQNGYPRPEGIYQYAVGADKVFARDLIETHYRCCLYAGIPICGTNAEVAPSQWEYQVGPSVGVNIGDDLWMSRFILERLAEEYGLIIEYDPKPEKDWNGSGAHANFSTKKMREENGIIEIEKAIDKLSTVHVKHIKVYDAHGGQDNVRRLTGNKETGHIDHFTAGIATRSRSVRIPRAVAEDKKGYLEDRRPASNCDPYLVAGALMRTCILNE